MKPAWTPNKVKLFDGKEALSDSPEWLLECQARHILKQNDIDVRRTLLAVGEKRQGKAAKENVEKLARAIWLAAKGVI